MVYPFRANAGTGNNHAAVRDCANLSVTRPSASPHAVEKVMLSDRPSQ